MDVWSASSDLKINSKSKLNQFSSPKSPSFAPLSFLRYLLILYNVLIIIGYLTPVITDHLPEEQARAILLFLHGAEILDYLPRENSTKPMNFGEYFARTGDDKSTRSSEDQFNQLKPVIRYIVRSLVAVFFLEGAVSFLHNLLFGGALLRQLAAVSFQKSLGGSMVSKRFNCSKKHAFLVISLLLLTIPLMMTAGLVFFNQQMARENDGQKSSWRSFLPSTSRLQKLAIHLWHFMALSTYSILFIISMRMFGRRLEEMIDWVEGFEKKKKVGQKGNGFGETELADLHAQIDALLGHFRSTLYCLSLPVICTLSASTFTLIGSVCFLMISPDRSYASFIFSIGLFALLRLLTVASVGNVATNAYRKLLRTVYETMEEGDDDGEEGDNPGAWSVDGWLLFAELRRLKPEFKVAFFAGTFTVRQSSILTLIGFSLNYVVILLQTENYDGGAGGNYSTLSNATSGN